MTTSKPIEAVSDKVPDAWSMVEQHMGAHVSFLFLRWYYLPSPVPVLACPPHLGRKPGVVMASSDLHNPPHR